jgi:hypothetical protein
LNYIFFCCKIENSLKLILARSNIQFEAFFLQRNRFYQLVG